MGFSLTNLFSTLHLQYLFRVRAVGSRTEKYVQVTGLRARRHSGALLFCPKNFPAESLTITLSLHRRVAFVVFHSSREPGMIQSTSSAVSWSLPSYTVWLRTNVTLNMVLWCLGFFTSHLHFRFIFLPFLCFHLHNSFFCFCSLLHWHFWRNQNSYAVLKFRANNLTVLLSQKLLTTGH